MSELNIPYVCPVTGSKLQTTENQNEWVSAEARRYSAKDVFPDFTYPSQLQEKEAQARLAYNNLGGDDYENFVHWLGQTFGEDTVQLRNEMIDLLQLQPASRVLETAAGSGLDSMLIAQRLGEEGILCIQDLSSIMLDKAASNLADSAPKIQLHTGNASYLPFADNQFDAYYHVGSINEFTDPARAFTEACRVTRPGGRVLFCDEQVPVWQRETEFGRILINSNPLYASPLPLEHIPVEARDVAVKWVLGGVFYVLTFVVGESEPRANFDLPMPIHPEDSLRKRYERALRAKESQVIDE